MCVFIARLHASCEAAECDIGVALSASVRPSVWQHDERTCLQQKVDKN